MWAKIAGAARRETPYKHPRRCAPENTLNFLALRAGKKLKMSGAAHRKKALGKFLALAAENQENPRRCAPETPLKSIRRCAPGKTKKIPALCAGKT